MITDSQKLKFLEKLYNYTPRLLALRNELIKAGLV